MKRYECVVCGLIYDEALGWPEDGIEPGTRWEDVPEDWLCPDCGVGKEDFELIEATPGESDISDTATTPTADAPIIIIGTGLAGYGLAREIRKIDNTTPLCLITQDAGESYSKPMLSTGFTKNSSAQDLVQFDQDTMADTLNAELLTNTRVTNIDTTRQTLSLDGDHTPQRAYSKLVLALGADVISPPMEGDAPEKIFSINNLQDYARFRTALEKTEAKRICVIGAGLIGCEYTNDLLNGGYEIQVVDALSTCLPTLVPEAAGRAIQSSLEAAGVVFQFQTTVEGVYHDGKGVSVALANGETLKADLVVSAIGVRPSTALAKQTGVTVNRGIATDRYLQTSARNIYAMGDCAEVDGLVLVYVAPLMTQARALAKTLTGNATAVSYPPMPVTVKLPACPTVVAPPDRGLAGNWDIIADGSNIKAEFRNAAGELCGFALTGSYVEVKRELQAQLPPLLA